MKHHLRKEKNCLNCGAEVTDRYCSHCGQENVQPKETFGYLVRHFFEDVTHYDSKFFLTLKYLLFRPGFLMKEWMAGRRAAYLNPIRMYIFISFVFFLILFLHKDEPEGDSKDIMTAKQELADSLRKSNVLSAHNLYDSIKQKVTDSIAEALNPTDTSKNEEVGFAAGNGGIKFTLKENRYNRVAEYDSVQRTLSADKRDQGFLRWLIRGNINLKERYGSRGQVVVRENFNHSVPKLMFILLPVFALLIAMMHSRKKYTYAQHIIFSVQFHSFTFILFLVVMLLRLLLPFGIMQDILTYATFALVLFYLSAALKRAYSQSWWAAALKTIAISVPYIIIQAVSIVALAMLIFFTT